MWWISAGADGNVSKEPRLQGQRPAVVLHHRLLRPWCTQRLFLAFASSDSSVYHPYKNLHCLGGMRLRRGYYYIRDPLLRRAADRMRHLPAAATRKWNAVQSCLQRKRRRMRPLCYPGGYKGSRKAH